MCKKKPKSLYAKSKLLLLMDVSLYVYTKKQDVAASNRENKAEKIAQKGLLLCINLPDQKSCNCKENLERFECCHL